MPRRPPVPPIGRPLVGATRGPLPPPPDRGRLVYDVEIPAAFFGGLPHLTNPVRWVREHLPKAQAIRIGRQLAWFTKDVEDWIESRRGR